MDQAISTNGPCLTNLDGNSTRLNDWSWNNEFNLIYIDNTIHAGFSYDVAINAVRDMATSWIKPGDGKEIPESDRSKRKGVYSSQDIAVGPNTTAIMAKTVSRFFQLWFDECVTIYTLRPAKALQPCPLIREIGSMSI